MDKKWVHFDGSECLETNKGVVPRDRALPFNYLCEEHKKQVMVVSNEQTYSPPVWTELFEPGLPLILTDPDTGGQKESKLAQLGNVDPLALNELAKVAGYGAEKYGDPYNFLKGYRWSLSYNALQRHLASAWSRDPVDDESGQLHMAHAMWHCAALISFMIRGIGTDDRPPVYNPDKDDR